jgi:hypothetical protein
MRTVSEVTTYILDGKFSIVGMVFFSYSCIETGPGTHRALYTVGTRVVKRPVRVVLRLGVHGFFVIITIIIIIVVVVIIIIMS